MKKRFVYLIIILILVLAAGVVLNRYFFKSEQNNQIILSASPSNILLSPSIKLTDTPEPSPVSTPIPSEFLIENFPFQSQAPFANWDDLHNEACEEASVILVKWWLSDKSTISAEAMDEEILKLVEWQEKNFGGHHDLAVEKTLQMAESNYGLSGKTYDDVDISKIKSHVIQNHPVIFPAAGRLLGNPNFRQPGPIYHMSVIIGYKDNDFIVQDVGTRRGDHYKYNQQVLFNAIHDWSGSPENIESGGKTMLILSN